MPSFQPADAIPESTGPAELNRRRGRWSTRFAAAVRWLHIYLSLLGFSAILFFSITGFTLNHPDWFGADAQRIVDLEGQVPTEVFSPADANSDSREQPSSAGLPEPNQLQIVEWLRPALGLRGKVTEFRVDDYECLILFRAPAYAADVSIERNSGRYRGSVVESGTVALWNDLHKGRDSGPWWSLLIDLTAALMVLVSITGFVLIFYIRRRRRSGVLTAVAGTFLAIAVWWLGVP